MNRFLFPAVLFLLFVAVGCKQDCTPSSCRDGTYCLAGDCISECVTATDCPASVCDPEDDCCEQGMSCNTGGRCIASPTSEQCDVPPMLPADGWDDPPGSGVTFIVNAIAIGPEQAGANLDGRCDDGGCIDNALWHLGELGNDQIRQGLLGGESLMLIEIAGLTPDYDGFDRSVTVKLYSVRDADDPFFPANNFKIPPGHTTCCEFLVRRQSLEGDGRTARARIPARIRNGRIESVEAATMPWPFPFCPDAPTREFVFQKSVFVAELPSNLASIDQVAFSGALSAANLQMLDNPYCKTVSPRCPVQLDDSSLHDLIRALSAPQADIDIDGDGIECAYDTDGDGRVDLCCEGAQTFGCSADARCAGARITFSDPSKPEGCVQKMVDGFSVTLLMTGLPAKVIGTN